MRVPNSSGSPSLPSSRSRFGVALGSTLAAVGLVSAMAACGSRTGLFADETALLPDGAPPADARVDAPVDGAVPCTPGKFAFELATAQLMFVVDRSGSMAYSLDGQQPDENGRLPLGVPSRWNVLRDSLVETLTPFDTALALGAKFYPEEHTLGPAPPDEACATADGVGIAPGRGKAQEILRVFDRTPPNGGTPTAEAVRLAAKYLAGTRSVARTLVVATDGAPNCNEDLDKTRCVCTSSVTSCASSRTGEYNCLDDVRAVRVITDIFQNQKIPVYVVGIGGEERPELAKALEDMAVAGGRAKPTSPRHYRVQTPEEMRDAFTTIRDSVARCTYLTPSAPTDPSAITVEIDGRPIPRDPTRTFGWDWVDREFGTLAFFGEACTLASGGSSTVNGVVRCDNP